MKKRILSVLLVLLLVIGLMPTAVFADTPKTLYVNGSYAENDSDGSEAKPYTTVQAAIAAASAGDTIKVMAAATEYDAFTIPKDYTGLIIEGVADGSGNKPVIKTCYEGSPTWTGYYTNGAPAGNTTGNGGISLYAGDVSLKNLHIVHYGVTKGWHTSSVGYYYENTSPKDNLTVYGCDFVGQGSGTAIMYNESNFTLQNSTFDGFATGYFCAGDNITLKEVNITGNTYEDVNTVVNVYWGGDPSAAPGTENTIAITGNTITNTDGEAGGIIVNDYGQENPAKGYAAVNVTITGNTGASEITLGSVNMIKTNTIVLDAAAAEQTTVYHAVNVNPGDYSSVTVTTDDGKSQTVTTNKKVSLPVTTDMIFQDENGSPITVTGAEPVKMTYTTSGGATVTVDAAVVASVPNSSEATLNNVDQNGDATDEPITVPDATDVFAAQIGQEKYTTLTDAFTAAKNMTNPTIEILSDITVDVWHTVYNADGWTLDGGNHTLTISEVNGDPGVQSFALMFTKAGDLHISDLTIQITGKGSGFSMKSGTLNNVHMIGAGAANSEYSVFADADAVDNRVLTITGCTFQNFNYMMYAEDWQGVIPADVTITDSEISDCNLLVTVAENTTLTDNTFTNVASVSLNGAIDPENTNPIYTVTGNTFTNSSVDLWDAPLDNVTFTENKMDVNSAIAVNNTGTDNSTGTLDVNNNYWGSEAGPSASQVVVPTDTKVENDRWFVNPSMNNTNQTAPYTPPIQITYRNDSFATATGEFKDVAYYGRAAREGDIVTLKVALSELGEQFGLDFTKIEVRYTVEGATQITDNYLYTGDPVYVDGIATDFMLNAGTNVIIAHIYYNGFEAGTCAPFYIQI